MFAAEKKGYVGVLVQGGQRLTGEGFERSVLEHSFSLLGGIPLRCDDGGFRRYEQDVFGVRGPFG